VGNPWSGSLAGAGVVLLFAAGRKALRLYQTQKHSRIEVWFSGDSDQYGGAHSLIIRPRSKEKMRGGFGPTFRASFEITSVSQAVEAAEFLLQVSYPASAVKSTRGRRPHGTPFLATQEENT